MKHYLPIALLLFILASCGITQRRYMPGYYFDKPTKKSTERPAEVKITEPEPGSEAPLEVTASIEAAPAPSSSFAPDFSTGSKNVYTPSTSACDVVTMKSGEEVEVKITEISETEIKYKKCDNPDGPTIVVSKQKVFMIKYANGTKEIIKDEKPSNTGSTSPAPQGQGQNKGLALGSLISGILGFVLIPFLGGLGGVILGVLALGKIKQQPEVYGGRGMAIAGIVLGAVSIIVMLLVFAVLL